MKGLKYISVLLLVNICILVGHNLVPHHHHLTSVDHPLSNECPETHKCPETHECPETSHEHHDDNGGTMYCHAFNNIAFVKYSQSQVPIPEMISSFIIFPDAGDAPDLNTGISSAPGHIVNRLPLSPEFSGNHSLRGPPVLS